jgi:hypothetical protein
MVVVALVAMTVADVTAQPKVTISGFVDNVTSYTRNMSIVDINPARFGDDEWYARTRVRPDITAEVGTTKFVLGLEMDAAWGQTGSGDVAGPNRAGASGGFDLNTDLGAGGNSIVELKWAYTEFRVPGIPFGTVFRIGAQPWQAQYKLAALANGDFAGVHITNQWSPMVKTNFTYAFIEEESTGPRDGFVRGEDFAIIASVEITPFKGLDLRPLFSWAQYVGPTNGASRQARGGVGTGSPVPFAVCPSGTVTGIVGGTCPAVAAGGSSVENRYTVGIDARWRFGAFSLDPTFFYQFGNREMVLTIPTATQNPGTHNQDISAWLLDIRGGWQAGPLLLEAAFIYSSGNSKEDRLDIAEEDVNFYQPISTDTSYYATWAEIWALGIDYFNIINSGAAGLNPGVAIGYDKYGLMRVGFRASYALTPAFTMRAGVTASWTAEETGGTLETISAGTGRLSCGPFTVADAVTTGACNTALNNHDGSSFLGTELNVGFQWRFAPNVAFDMVGSYMFAGNALAAHTATNATTGVVSNARNPQDIQALTARVRYSW